MSIVVLKVGFVPCRASSEKTKDNTSIAISTNVSCYQTLCRQQYYFPFSNIAHACTSAWCAQQFNSCAQNSQLHFSWAM